MDYNWGRIWKNIYKPILNADSSEVGVDILINRQGKNLRNLFIWKFRSKKSSPKSLERLSAKTGSCLPYIACYKDDALRWKNLNLCEAEFFCNDPTSRQTHCCQVIEIFWLYYFQSFLNHSTYRFLTCYNYNISCIDNNICNVLCWKSLKLIK